MKGGESCRRTLRQFPYANKEVITSATINISLIFFLFFFLSFLDFLLLVLVRFYQPFLSSYLFKTMIFLYSYTSIFSFLFVLVCVRSKIFLFLSNLFFDRDSFCILDTLFYFPSLWKQWGHLFFMCLGIHFIHLGQRLYPLCVSDFIFNVFLQHLYCI